MSRSLGSCKNSYAALGSQNRQDQRFIDYEASSLLKLSALSDGIKNRASGSFFHAARFEHLDRIGLFPFQLRDPITKSRLQIPIMCTDRGVYNFRTLDTLESFPSPVRGDSFSPIKNHWHSRIVYDWFTFTALLADDDFRANFLLLTETLEVTEIDPCDDTIYDSEKRYAAWERHKNSSSSEEVRALKGLLKCEQIASDKRDAAEKRAMFLSLI